MDPLLETKRLVFYRFVPEDLPLLMDLHSDLEVMRYLSSDGQLWSRGELQSKLDRYVSEQENRCHSKWKVYHHGRVFGGAGDSVIAEFASPVEAVRCATEIQLELDKRTSGSPA